MPRMIPAPYPKSPADGNAPSPGRLTGLRHGTIKLRLRIAPGAGRFAQHVAQHECVIHAHIAAGVQQCDALSRGARSQRLQLRRLRAQLGAVAAPELAPAGTVVMEPLAQRRARRELAEPGIEPGPPAADTAGPQAVDEHAIAVRALDRRIDALDLDAGRGRGLRFELVQVTGR